MQDSCSGFWRFRWWLSRSLVRRRAVNARGLTFTLPCENWMTYRRWRTYNSKEPETLDWIDNTMADRDVFFDVGANIGVYTIYAALRHPEARILAFEPEYANLHLLKDNIVENGLQDRVEVFSLALSNRSGLSYLHLSDFTPGTALHTESVDPLSFTRYEQRVVWREGICTVTLDEFCDRRGLQPNCIKIDVDGTEPEVLEGATGTLRSPQLRSLIIELPLQDPARSESMRLLHAAGLRCAWRDPLAPNANEIWLRDGA